MACIVMAYVVIAYIPYGLHSHDIYIAYALNSLWSI